MKTVYKQALESKADMFLFGELLLSMLTIIYGKLKYLDVLYAARDATSIATGRHLPTIKTAIEAGTYDEEYAKFRDCLSTHLSKQSQLSLEEAKKVVDKAMTAYMKKYYFTKKRLAPLTTAAGLMLDRLNFPGWLKKGIRRSYARFTGTEYIEKGTEDLSLSSLYYEDINKIRQHVLSFSVTNAVKGKYTS